MESNSEVKPFNIQYNVDTLSTITKGKGLCGIVNLGFTCYLNSVVQSLSNTIWLRDFLLTDKFQEVVNKENNHYIMINELCKVIKGLWWKNANIKPESFLYWTRKLSYKLGDGQFVDMGQKDSGEFLIFVLDMLHESLSRKISDGFLEHDEFEFYKNGYSEIVENFNIYLNNSIKCVNCDHISHKYDPANVLALEIPNITDNDVVKLSDCFRNFVKVERLDDDNKYKCEKCNTLSNAEKTLEIKKTSKYLIILLKRFSFINEHSIHKKNTLVDFPVEELDMSEYIKDGKKYRLYATSNHIGNRNNGHYFSCCLNDNNWYKYDDDKITTLDRNDLVNNSSYILFYEQY